MSIEEIEAWLEEREAARPKMRQRSHEPQRHNGGIGAAPSPAVRPARDEPH